MQADPQFETLLVYLKEMRGFDFTGYKRASLMRRVTRRMTQVNVQSYPEYVDYLEVHPDEFTALFNMILINVTGFFRDPEAWKYLESDVLPKLLATKEPRDPIRVWSAGCASGEEAYTLAMLLAETIGPEAFRQRVKIYATDVDEEALNHARHAEYGVRDIQDVAPELVSTYFENVGYRYTFRKDLRRSIIFGRNDLVQDAPISRIDLLVSRNALMYFNAETQARILSRFHFALANGGVLFLGKAEMLLSNAAIFVPIDVKWRVFRKVAREMPGNGGLLLEPMSTRSHNPGSGLDRLRNEAFMASPEAQVVLSADGRVTLTNRHAEVLLGLSTNDIGRQFRDLELSYRPIELRGYIEQAQAERRIARIADVEYTANGGEVLNLDVQVSPLLGSDGNLAGVTLAFLDMTASRRLRDELASANRQLETAYEELQSTNEELETTNEELQSTVEELETTNEELQSTNEELETMNEELQSTNDELQSVNDELRDRTAELDNVNDFLEAVFISLRTGVAVINREMQVRVWNRGAEDLWGLRKDEAVGEHVLNLDIGLPFQEVRPLIQRVFAGDDESSELRVPAVNRKGRTIEVRVVCWPLLHNDGERGRTGAILVMEPTDPSELSASRSPG
jgi:two-component system CheB/CheR fusion protein